MDAGDPSGATAENHALETRAAVAAAWSAKRRIEHSGRPQVYRAGFYQGLRAALRDPLIGAWDYQQGIVAGQADPQAHLAGAEIGLEDAERAAEEAARRLDPQAGTPVFTASMPDVRKPRMVDVFRDHPLADFLGQTAIRPLPDPWKLYRCNDTNDFYDSRWSDPDKAFDDWLRHHHDRAMWSEMNGEKARFEGLFKSSFSYQLKGLFAAVGDSVYGAGHDDGWDYGSLIAHEWSYREGYHEGFETALHDSAKSAFLERYPRSPLPALPRRESEITAAVDGNGK